MEQTKTSKRKYGVAFILILCCIFIFTVGQFIPVYFIDINVRQKFYVGVLSVLLIATTLTVFSFAYKPHRNKFLVGLTSVFVGVITCILFGFWYFFLSLAVWTETATYYVDKDNNKVKIISRYLNEGAFGGGTESSDFEIVLQRPVLNLFNIQTKIDTTSIDKNKWIKYKE
ncbi:MAG TPA: hypothetical protein VHB70_11800 [Parafilimonas sp.]|nr:hypothetical protein [Parafilimonas sp.]